MKILTFLTDFGEKSGYVAQMKAVALSLAQPLQCIDISHQVPPQNIQVGAFILKNTVPHFPKGSVHVAVVDPGVGTERNGIVVITKSHILVGPDNGLLIPVAQELGDFKVYKIENASLFHHPVSNTFHGRDIFTPVAAHILNGVRFEQIGPQINHFMDAVSQKPRLMADVIQGSVVFIDDFGNIITNIASSDIDKMMQKPYDIIIKIKEKSFTLPFKKSYSLVSKGSCLALIGSNGYLEISMNQGNAAKHLNVAIGDEVFISSMEKKDK